VFNGLNLHSIPDDLNIEIAKHLNYKEISSLGAVSKNYSVLREKLLDAPSTTYKEDFFHKLLLGKDSDSCFDNGLQNTIIKHAPPTVLFTVLTNFLHKFSSTNQILLLNMDPKLIKDKPSALKTVLRSHIQYLQPESQALLLNMDPGLIQSKRYVLQTIIGDQMMPRLRWLHPDSQRILLNMDPKLIEDKPGALREAFNRYFRYLHPESQKLLLNMDPGLITDKPGALRCVLKFSFVFLDSVNQTLLLKMDPGLITNKTGALKYILHSRELDTALRERVQTVLNRDSRTVRWSDRERIRNRDEREHLDFKN
jgi:hypothetical protein